MGYTPVKAFTLIELSVVIVVIGLIVGGIMVGEQVIRASKLNSFLKEVTQYKQAIQLFREQYAFLPGDYPSAATVWGAYAAGPPVTGARNGNGDLQVGTVSAAVADHGESKQAWRQLSLAGFIPSVNYSGSLSTSWTPKTYFPPSALTPNGGWWIWITSLQYGGAKSNYADYPAGGAISPKEAYRIDTKIDDGNASSGLVTSVQGSWTTDICLNAGNYSASSSGTGCRMIFDILQ